jgi:DNA (cytosine-5)-methyltransferase 1
MVDASHFVPQSRELLFVIGVQSDSVISEMAEQQGFYQSGLRPKGLADFILTHPEVDWNIRRLPTPPTTEKTLDDVLEDLDDEAAEWWTAPRSEYLLNQMSPKHLDIAKKMIEGRGWSYGTVFRRVRIRDGIKKSMAELRTDGVAGCLRTPRGGSGRQILFKAGNGSYQARLLTPRECARLMGADDFKITAPQNQALFGFGDAVCVSVIEWIAKHYLNPLIAELLRSRTLPPFGPKWNNNNNAKLVSD